MVSLKAASRLNDYCGSGFHIQYHLFFPNNEILLFFRVFGIHFACGHLPEGKWPLYLMSGGWLVDFRLEVVYLRNQTRFVPGCMKTPDLKIITV
jgi:hypothetical protein